MQNAFGTLTASQLYSEELGIKLGTVRDAEIFKWFLASILFGARISENIARHTYEAFARHGLLTPQCILGAGWDVLVSQIMSEGGYVRYDEKKSTQILTVCQGLLADYDGSLNGLHDVATSSRELEAKIGAFFGVGPVTTNIFLRELRPFWRHADPAPLAFVTEEARLLGIDLAGFDRKSIEFTRLEAGLIRQRRSMQRKRNAPATHRGRTQA